MILEFDAGNTRIKWRQLSVESGLVLDEGVFADLDAMLASPLADTRPLQVRMCSVRSAELTERLRQWSAVVLGREAELAVVTRSCGGVSNQYDDMSRMGADRWLGMIAAYNRIQGACVVVDAGTALTIDVVSASGLHEGGYILPGRRMMTSSLEANTAIRLRHIDSDSLDLGNDTDAAVLHGALASQVALVEWVLGRLSLDNRTPRIILTGGDADALLAGMATPGAEIIPSLVLDGLAYACPYTHTP